MTPMLDIVFIMLIFFIVTATFLDEKGVDLTQPPPPPDDINTPPSNNPAITVYVDGRDNCLSTNAQPGVTGSFSALSVCWLKSQMQRSFFGWTSGPTTEI